MSSTKRMKTAKCPKCGKEIKTEGVIFDGKFYHEECGKGLKKVKALGFVDKVKKIFIA